MRIVISIDGDLLVPRNQSLGISGQREEIARVVESLSGLLAGPHEIVITHGNAPQIGYMLLRSEVASHVVHNLPLDVCGSDTQGATGYLLQQAIGNCLRERKAVKDIATLVTQVLVDVQDPAFNQPTRGIGPFFDRDKAQMYTTSRSWVFALTPGRGYRRAVPSLMPLRVIEASSVRRLVDRETIVICAGGGGVPVVEDRCGQLVGVDAVVDKAFTASLLAAEIGAEAILFVSWCEHLEQTLQISMNCKPHPLALEDLDRYIQLARDLDPDLANKLKAGRMFLERGGKSVLIAPAGKLEPRPQFEPGVFLMKA